jgi:hypothetical protein
MECPGRKTGAWLTTLGEQNREPTGIVYAQIVGDLIL